MSTGTLVSKEPAIPRAVAVLLESPSVTTRLPVPPLVSAIWMPLPAEFSEAVMPTPLDEAALLIASRMFCTLVPPDRLTVMDFPARSVREIWPRLIPLPPFNVEMSVEFRLAMSGLPAMTPLVPL